MLRAALAALGGLMVAEGGFWGWALLSGWEGWGLTPEFWASGPTLGEVALALAPALLCLLGAGAGLGLLLMAAAMRR